MITQLKDGTTILNGWQEGIADSPHLGPADIRNINLTSSPGEAAVNFKTSAMNQPPVVTAVAFTVETTDIITVPSTTGWYAGMAITLNSLVGGTGLATGRVYWVGSISGNTFKPYTNPANAVTATSPVNVTLAGSGTLSSYTFSAPLDKSIFYSGTSSLIRTYIFILDDTGKVWWIQNTGGNLTNNLVYLGNDTLTGTTGRAVVVFNNYIIVFRSSTMDYLQAQNIESGVDLDSGSGWVYGWESASGVALARRPTLVGQDNVLYYDNDNRIGSISVIGSIFDPNSSATYNKNTSALDLPNKDEVRSLGEQGTNLLIGGMREFVYPWDRISPSFDYPLILPENNTTRIVSSNQIAFLFNGTRGQIYVTNGASVELFKKVPDYITEVYEPYFAWTDAMVWRNQLYFSFTATTNAGVALTSTGGVWGIDMTSGAFRCTNQLSYGSYAGSATVLLPHVLSANPPGSGIYVGWSVNSTYGVDVSSTEPYQNYDARIDTEIVPVGTFVEKYTPRHFEFKMAMPMVAGESIRLSGRKSLSDSFEVIGTTTSTVLSAPYDTPFEDWEWLQFRIEMSSTATNPSYNRLTEIRVNGQA